MTYHYWPTIALFEAGSPAAIAFGLACFVFLVIAGVTVGYALLAPLTFPANPRNLLLLAPFAATVVWALTGNLLVHMGFTMAQATPIMWLASLGLAAVGIRSIVLAGLRLTTVAGRITGPVLVALVAMQTSVARGLTAHVGSPNFDRVNYSEIGATYWRYGLDTLTNRPPFFQSLIPLVTKIGRARNHTYVLISFFSSLVKVAEPLFVRNVLVCWSLFILARSVALYRSSWPSEYEETPNASWTTLVYVIVTVGTGWVAVPALVGNWDNALFVSVGPVLAALAGVTKKGWAYPAFLGTIVAYGVYTYTELALLMGLVLLPLYFRPLLDRATRASSLKAYGFAATIAIVLLSIDAKHIVAYFWSQFHAARDTNALRPGGSFAAGLVESPLDPAAWWALGAEHPHVGYSWHSLLGGLLTVIALVGMWKLWRRQRWPEISALGILGALVGYFVLVDRYGYAGYKLLSVSWWLVGLCITEGTIAAFALARTHTSSGRQLRILRWSPVVAVAVVVTTGLAVEHIHQREIYMPDSAFTRQPTVAAMMRLEKAAMNWPRTEVLVIDPLTDYLELPWNFYALKDTPLHAYHSASLNARIPGGEAWALNNRLPQHIMVRPDTANGAPLFATPEFAIVNLRSKVYVEHVETPNGSEQWATSWETNRSPSHC